MANIAPKNNSILYIFILINR